MELTPAAVQQIRDEVKQASMRGPGAMPATLSKDDICKNKKLIMDFLNVLVSLIPGIPGKIVGQIVVAAAEGWFASNCPN